MLNAVNCDNPALQRKDKFMKVLLSLLMFFGFRFEAMGQELTDVEMAQVLARKDRPEDTMTPNQLAGPAPAGAIRVEGGIKMNIYYYPNQMEIDFEAEPRPASRPPTLNRHLFKVWSQSERQSTLAIAAIWNELRSQPEQNKVVAIRITGHAAPWSEFDDTIYKGGLQLPYEHTEVMVRGTWMSLADLTNQYVGYLGRTDTEPCRMATLGFPFR